MVNINPQVAAAMQTNPKISAVKCQANTQLANKHAVDQRCHVWMDSGIAIEKRAGACVSSAWALPVLVLCQCLLKVQQTTPKYKHSVHPMVSPSRQGPAVILRLHDALAAPQVASYCAILCSHSRRFPAACCCLHRLRYCFCTCRSFYPEFSYMSLVLFHIGNKTNLFLLRRET